MLLVVVLSFLAFLSIDIPSALSGGEEIYVNELPTRIAFSINIVYVDTDDEILKQLKGCDWNKYEKYGNYRIRYTKFNKIVLDIERLD